MTSETEFNPIPFEKRLSTLTNSQDSINSCCNWCLQNRIQHKKIVCAWLSVLKRVKVEQRLTLFYLANDVIQYSKRKNYEYVESWGTALQKATTMVRDEKVKHKILRIFKIWEERGIYGEEFITDLCGLISVSPSSNKKGDETHEFQASSLINKIRTCAKLETDTDYKLKLFKEHNPKMLNSEALCASLKDRAHVDDVEKEMDEYVKHMEQYVNALKSEIKARAVLITLLLQAETQLEKDRKDVKVVTLAYKSFATRVKNLKKKLDERLLTLLSPVPSPDINAPSPSQDSDDPPDDPPDDTPKDTFASAFTNAGFYNPVAAISSGGDGFSNGFTSFLGSNLPFNLQNIDTSAIFGNNNDSLDTSSASLSNQTHTTNSNIYANDAISSLFSSIIQPPPPPSTIPTPVVAPTTTEYQYNNEPLAPPPLPPFNKLDDMYGTENTNYGDYNSQMNNYGNGSYDQLNTSVQYEPENTSYNTSIDYSQPITTFQSNPTNFPSSVAAQPQADAYAAYDPFTTEDYNPEEEPETWDEPQWDQPPNELDTPVSPPSFEKESSFAPREYHDGQNLSGAVDVDHRVLISNKKLQEKKNDIDHRNLISLTGSPKEDSNSNSLNSQGDQDYRSKNSNAMKRQTDQDYRTDLIAPPPKQPKLKKANQSPRKIQDNVENVDMELSDDECLIPEITNVGSLLPPPPFPDDADAIHLLDSLNDDIDNCDNTGGGPPLWEEEQQHLQQQQQPQTPKKSLLGDGPTQFMQQMAMGEWMDVPPTPPPAFNGHPPPLQGGREWYPPPHPPHESLGGFRGGRGNMRGGDNHFGGNRGEFNDRGSDYRGRGRGRGGDRFRGRGGGNDRGGRGGSRGWRNGRGRFNGRGNFRGGY